MTSRSFRSRSTIRSRVRSSSSCGTLSPMSTATTSSTASLWTTSGTWPPPDTPASTSATTEARTDIRAAQRARKNDPILSPQVHRGESSTPSTTLSRASTSLPPASSIGLTMPSARPTSGTSDTARTWCVFKASPGNVFAAADYSSAILFLFFQQEGTYDVVLSAWNPLDNWLSSRSTRVEVLEKVGPVHIDDKLVVSDMVCEDT